MTLRVLQFVKASLLNLGFRIHLNCHGLRAETPMEHFV